MATRRPLQEVILRVYVNLALSVSVLATSISLSGYKVLDVRVNTQSDWQTVRTFIELAKEEYDVWRWPESLGESLHVALSPTQVQEWAQLCSSTGIQCTYMVDDLQSLVELEMSTSRINSIQQARRHRRESDSKVLHRLSGYYPTWAQVESWLLDLNTTESLVNVIDVGKSHEGRHLYIVQIKAPDTPTDAAEIFIDTGIHAREWIAQTSGIYIIAQLVEGYYQRTKIRPLVEDLVWYIMPVVNPDGYVYSHEEYRFWRKNRSPPPENVRDGYLNKTCIGVDLNRNWGFHWGEVGVSRNSCSLIYPGHEAMSELETKAVSHFMLTRRNLHAYVNVHSYGQLFLTRYGYSSVTPSDHQELLSLAKHVARTITSVHNATYTSGTSPDSLYPYSGGVADWAKGVAEVKFSYTTELRDRGRFGFVLPANYVIPVGEELFAGLVAMGERVLERAINISQSGNEDDIDEYSSTASEDGQYTTAAISTASDDGQYTTAAISTASDDGQYTTAAISTASDGGQYTTAAISTASDDGQYTTAETGVGFVDNSVTFGDATVNHISNHTTRKTYIFSNAGCILFGSLSLVTIGSLAVTLFIFMNQLTNRV